MPNAKSFDLLYNYLLSEHYDKLPLKVIFKIALKAKAMHMEEIEDAYWQGGQKVPTAKECIEYYDKTYGGNK